MSGFTCRHAKRFLSGLGRKIDGIVAVMVIVRLERSRCRRIGFVLVAASRILEQGRNDRQQHDHNYAEDGDARDQELDDAHVSILTRLAVKNISLGPASADETAIPARSL
jgi:deoxycytidylate deaminase